MSGQGVAVLFFCLATGAALGCLFLLFRGFSALLGFRKWGTAFVDLIFCCLCGAVVFLCALAVDKGRLRLYQAGLQALGAWAVVAALGPWLGKSVEGLKRFFWKVSAILARRMGFLRGLFTRGKDTRGKRGKKTGKKPKKQRKKT